MKKNILPKGYFYHHEGYLWYTLPTEKFLDLPEIVKLGGNEFSVKQEFHVTIANVKAMAQAITENNTDTEDVEHVIQKLLTKYLQKNVISFEKFEDDLRLAVTKNRKSIAARCRINGIEGYFNLINRHYKKSFPLQPTHVTIYTINGLGVGINTNQQMESYTKITLPKVQKVLNSIDL